MHALLIYGLVVGWLEAIGGETISDEATSGGVDWILVFTVIGTIAAGISAVGVIAAAIYWARTRSARADRVEREKQMSSDIAEMGESIEQLEKVIGAVVEDVRDRRPEPVVSFLTRDGPADSIVISQAAPPEVDVEAIVTSELRAALATLPREPSGRTASPVALEASLRKLARMGLGGGQYLPVTQEDRENFEASVEAYADAVRDFIPKWIAYLEACRELIGLRVLVDNRGGAPAQDARIRLRFPDPCVRAELPDKPGCRPRPTFSPRRNPLWSKAGLDVRMPVFRPPNIDLPDFNRTGPFYDDGSVKVRFEYPDIQHHDPIETDPFIVGIPEPGRYSVAWSVHASNLVRPEEGSLEVEVVWTEPDPTPLVTLDALLALGPQGD